MANAELGIRITANNQSKAAFGAVRKDILGIKSALGDVAKFAGGNLLAAGLQSGVRALAVGVKGMIGSFAGMAKEAADFNAQISTIGAVIGATSAEMAQLKGLASDLGIDPGLKVSATEAAQAIEMLGRNGLKVPDIMNGAAKATVLLANATGAEFATAADISSSAMAVFGISAADMTKAVDGITSVTTNSKMDINDYALAIAQGGGVAASSGVSFADFNTYLAGTASLFKSGSDSGTAFKTFLMRLNPQTKEATSLMKELGLMTEDGANAFFDSKGQMKDMAEISGILNKTFAGMSEQQRLNTLTTLFGTDAYRSAYGLMQLTEEEFRQLQATMSKTDATKAAAMRMDNLSGDMEIFQGVVDSLRIQMGDEFQPALREIYQAATSFLSGIQPLVVGFASNIADGISNTITAVEQQKTRFDGILASFGDNKIGGIVAGLGDLTGGTVAYDAEAKIVSVDWLGSIVGDATFSYDALANIFEVDWVSSLTGRGVSFTYDAEAGITKVDWDGVLKDFKFVYDAEAGITFVDWKSGFFSGTYMADASITNVGWGIYTHWYNASAKIDEKSILWGLYSHQYSSTSNVTSVLWGAYSHEYNAKAKVEETSVLWGLWTWTYDAKTNITDYSIAPELAQKLAEWAGQITIGAPEWLQKLVNYRIGDDFTWPALPTWTWPSYETWTWSALPTWTWPSLPKWTWPSIPTPSWLSSLLNWRPTLPSFFGGGDSVAQNAKGTKNFEGGWTWVGEEGPELLNLPKGSQILSNPESKKMIGQMADGNTTAPTGGLFGGFTKLLGFATSVLSSGIGDMTKSTEQLDSTIAKDTEATDAANAAAETAGAATNAALATNTGTLATTGELIRVSAEQFAMAANDSGSFVLDGVAHFTDSFSDLLDSFGDGLESALQNVPGLFGTSEVTADQMKLAELSVDQNFADDWIRRLTDEVMNGVDWDGVSIEDAAKRAGLDPGLPAQTLLEMVKQKWNDKSFFADPANLDLLNMDAVQASLQQQAAQKAGEQNLLALFGITPEQAQTQGAAAGASVGTGLLSGISTAVAGGDAGTGLAASLSEGITEDSMAAIGATVVGGLTTEMGKVEYGEQMAGAVAGLFTSFLENAEALKGVAQAIMEKVAAQFASVTGLDMVSKFAESFNAQLATTTAKESLAKVGEQILELVYSGYLGAAEEKNWAEGVNAKGKDTPPTPPVVTPPGNATGTRNWRGGLTWVGETGPELVNLPARSAIYSNANSMAMAGAGGGVNVTINATVADGIDIERLAHRVVDVISSRRR